MTDDEIREALLVEMEELNPRSLDTIRRYFSKSSVAIWRRYCS